jgi:DDE family transposase
LSKDKYKVKNWASYNEGLKRRGSITIWLNTEVTGQWKEMREGKLKRGGQRRYSNLAIETCLVVRKVYRLALRQAEGFIESIFSQAGVIMPVPDYTTLCRRASGLTVDLSVASKSGVTDIVVDSTGLKVYGEGEWKVRKHGAGKHRTWMKLHIALNSETQQVEAVSLTTNSITDADEAGKLINQIGKPVRSVTGDGAYDKDKVRKELYKKEIQQKIPPQRNATVDKKKRKFRAQRDEAIGLIAQKGRAEWKRELGYHHRSKAETAMFRYKTIIGPDLSAREPVNQKTEAVIGCKILNIMLQLTKPQSIKIA